MTLYVNWVKVPINYSIGYPQKNSVQLGGYGFDFIWKLNYTQLFNDEDREYTVHVKVILQQDKTVVYNGKLCQGSTYPVLSPWSGRLWFWLKVFNLDVADMDVRALPANWIRTGNWLIETD